MTFILKYIFSVTLLVLTGAGALAQETKEVTTRFGNLTVSDAGMLMFKGNPVQPKVEANNSLDLSVPYKIGVSDVVLVTNNGGSGCPASFYFVTVTKSAAKVTPSFGTCSDLIKVKRAGDSISVSMPGFAGESMSKKEQLRAARERHSYIYRAGVVTDNGKPIK